MGEVDARVTRMATVLPGGSNLRGGTCGILLGGLVAVGLKCGSIDRTERKACGPLGLRLHDAFRDLTREEFGTVDCRDISCCDFTNPEEAEGYLGSEAQHRCALLLADTVRFLLPMLDERVAS